MSVDSADALSTTLLPKGVVPVSDSPFPKERLPLFSRGSWSEADRIAQVYGARVEILDRPAGRAVLPLRDSTKDC